MSEQFAAMTRVGNLKLPTAIQAYRRMQDHNRLKKYVDSYDENCMLVRKMTDYLHERGVRIAS